MRNVLIGMCIWAICYIGCAPKTAQVIVLADQTTATTDDNTQYVVNGGPGSTEVIYRDSKGKELTAASNVIRVPIFEKCGELKKEEPTEEIKPPEVEPDQPPIEPVIPQEEEGAYPVEVNTLQNCVFISAIKMPEVFYQTDVYIEFQPPKIKLEKSSDEQKLCCDRQLTFRIKFTNEGGEDAKNIVIFDNIPQKVEYVEGTATSNPYLADILVDRDEEKIARKITWKIEGPIPPNGKGEVAYTVICPKQRPSLSCFFRFDPKILNAGQEGKLICNIVNTGSGEAENVKLIVNVPSGIEYLDNTIDQKVLLTFGNIPPKQTVTKEMAIRMRRGGELSNISGNVTADNWEGCECTVPQTPTLVIKKDGPPTAQNRNSIVYTIVVENTGKKEPATNCVLTDELPARIHFESASDNGVYDAKKNTITWPLGTLLPGARETRTITFVPQREGAFLDKAKVSCDEGITVDDDAVTTVSGITALEIQTYDTEDPVEVGSATIYVIEVRNEGFSNATDLILKTKTPPLTKFVSAEAENEEGKAISFDMTAEGGIIFNPILLPSGAKAIYKLTVQVTAAGQILHTCNVTCNEFKNIVVVEEPTMGY